MVVSNIHTIPRSFGVNTKSNYKNIERVKEYKLLGRIPEEYFELQFHVHKTLKDGYSTLRILKLLKRYTLYYLRKQICESLILSMLEHCNILFKTVPQNQNNRIDKLLSVQS